MKISASDFLGRIRDGWKVEKDTRWMAGEMLRHLEELAKRYYAGDIKVVDEFLHTYCLDKKKK